MKSPYTRRVLAATLLLGASPLAFAQEAPETLDTIIVTGVGPHRETDEMIGNATAINRDELVQKLSGTLGDTLASEPGVSTTFFGQGASRPVLRGLGAERVLVLTNGIGVIDVSAASPDHQAAADGIDAEKVEILRGPAALAYGGQAIGGVVNVIDGLIAEELPDEPISFDGLAATDSVSDGTEAAGKVRYTTGPFVLTLSASARDFGNYDIPGFAESSRFRANEEHEEGEAHEEGEEDHDHEHEEAYGTLENSFLQTGTFAGGLSWVGDNGFLGFGVRHQTAQYGLPGHEHAEEGHDGEEEAEHEEESPFIDLEQTRYDFRGGMNLNYGILTDLAANISVADYTHTEFEGPGEPGTRYDTDGSEGRLEIGNLIGNIEGAFGLQYLDKKLGAFGDEAFITPTKTKNLGVFVYETYELDDNAGLEGGLRFDDVELDNATAGKVDFNLVSGSVGAHAHLGTGWFTGVQLSYTERAPNESELFADGAHLATSQYEVGNTALNKEKGTNLEATIRWENDWLSAGGNLFLTDFDGFIYLTPGSTLNEGALTDVVDGIPVYLFSQQDAKFVGGEIYGEANIPQSALSADWTAKASVDFVNGELDDGGNIPYLPPVTFHSSVQADWKLWTVQANMTIAADQDDPGAGSLPTDGYTTFGARAALKLSALGFGQEGTQLFIEGRNLTDEEVRYSTSVLKDTVPAPGQNIRAGIKVSF